MVRVGLGQVKCREGHLELVLELVSSLDNISERCKSIYFMLFVSELEPQKFHTYYCWLFTHSQFLNASFS